MTKLSFGSLAGLLVIWLVAATLLDRFVVASACAWCSSAVSIDGSLLMPAANVPFPRVGLLTLVVVPMLLLAIILIPWTSLRDGDEWRKAITAWTAPVFWVGMLVIFVQLGKSLYLLTTDWIPQGVQEFSKAWALKIELRFGNLSPVTIDGELAAVVGFIAGGVLFVKFGLSPIPARVQNFFAEWQRKKQSKEYERLS